ncbi:MAG TPA: pyruvate kinase [Candidatus Dietzia intestinipullorum]|nr:pyruvate kinase [Candidatus Dietzia intestinipullorum]
MNRRTKIVSTLGPAVASEEGIRQLVDCGMDVARLNFSHGEHADHKQNYRWVRSAAEESGRAVGVLADLQGPKIRLGRFAEGRHEWAEGDKVAITIADVEGTKNRVSTTYKGLAADARPGDRLLVDDGNIALVVERVDGDDVHCVVTEGGIVSNNKGVSLPGMNVSVPALSEKDIADLRFALALGVDFIALSFVRSPADVDLVHEIMDEEDVHVPVIAKLEKPEAVKNLESIVLAFDAIMVARGDLGVELPLQEVPVVQKRAIQIARENAKPVIVATQMLESMISSSRPTRAEASDVANAVMDGADAVMLSGETSVGKYPYEAVRTMSSIALAVEADSTAAPDLVHIPRTKRGVISYSAREIGERLGAKALVAITATGDTVRRLARLHSHLPLIAVTADPRMRNQLTLTWGAETFLTDRINDTAEIVKVTDEMLLQVDGYNENDVIVIVAGNVPGVEGSTNSILVHRIGEADH